MSASERGVDMRARLNGGVYDLSNVPDVHPALLACGFVSGKMKQSRLRLELLGKLERLLKENIKYDVLNKKLGLD